MLSVQKLNILCIGKESLVINRLLQYFSKLCDESVVHSSGTALFGETREDKQTTADYFISGGVFSSCVLLPYIPY